MAKARARWGRLARILSRDGAAPRVMGRFYLALVQSVLLYGSETWVLTDPMLEVLRTFHHRSARYISRMFIRKGANEQWVCPPSKDVLEKAGLLPIETYIARRKATLWPYASATPIFQLCKTSPSVDRRKKWWTHDVPDGGNVA